MDGSEMVEALETLAAGHDFDDELEEAMKRRKARHVSTLLGSTKIMELSMELANAFEPYMGKTIGPKMLTEMITIAVFHLLDEYEELRKGTSGA